MDPRKMMGFVSPTDQKVPVPVRDWNAMKLALWRSKVGWEIVEREAAAVLEKCVHLDDCPGKDDESEPCFGATVFGQDKQELGCPDRELRMSALVMLNAARQFAPVNVRRLADAPYHAPSREYFSEVIAELMATQAEAEALREALRNANVPAPSPAPLVASALPAPSEKLLPA